MADPPSWSATIQQGGPMVRARESRRFPSDRIVDPATRPWTPRPRHVENEYLVPVDAYRPALESALQRLNKGTDLFYRLLYLRWSRSKPHTIFFTVTEYSTYYDAPKQQQLYGYYFLPKAGREVTGGASMTMDPQPPE